MENEAFFATVHNGRTEKIGNSVGMFVKTMPFHLAFGENDTVSDVLRRASEEHSSNIKHSLYSFADAANELSLSSDVIFAYQGDTYLKTVYNGKELRIINCPLHDGNSMLSIRI